MAAFLLASTPARGAAVAVRGPQGTLLVDDGGQGDVLPVVFVHGNAGNRAQWNAQLAHLRTRRQAVAVDLRGMGGSSPASDADYSIGAMASDLQVVAVALGLSRFVIVGHSFGAHVVARYAAEHPAQVAAVVFADPSGNVTVSDSQARDFVDSLRANKDDVVRRWLAGSLAPSNEHVRSAVLESFSKTSVEVIIGALESLRHSDIGASLDRFTGPRLAIVAAPLATPRSFQAQFPSIPTRKMEGVGHWLMMDKPDEFNRILDDFLQGIR